MEQIFLTYGLSKETVTAIMMPYRKTDIKVCSIDDDDDDGDNIYTCSIVTWHSHLDSAVQLAYFQLVKMLLW